MACGTSIYVANPSFETDTPNATWDGNISTGQWNYSITGWTVSNGGTWNPNWPNYYNVPPPNGVNVAWDNGGGTISQTLTTALVANATYTLIVYVGQRNDVPTFTRLFGGIIRRDSPAELR